MYSRSCTLSGAAPPRILSGSARSRCGALAAVSFRVPPAETAWQVTSRVTSTPSEAKIPPLRSLSTFVWGGGGGLRDPSEAGLPPQSARASALSSQTRLSRNRFVGSSAQAAALLCGAARLQRGALPRRGVRERVAGPRPRPCLASERLRCFLPGQGRAEQGLSLLRLAHLGRLVDGMGSLGVVAKDTGSTETVQHSAVHSIARIPGFH